MIPPNVPTNVAPGVPVDAELAELERKLAVLIAHTGALRAANEALRRDVAAANARNHVLAERVAEAKRRLDSLLARFPETAE